MRRIAAGLLTTGLMLAALASPVMAAQAPRGCPEPAFLSMTFYEFRAYAIASGLPESAYPTSPGAGWIAVDVNNDGVVCIKDLPDNYGTLGGFLFIGVDNNSNQ